MANEDWRQKYLKGVDLAPESVMPEVPDRASNKTIISGLPGIDAINRSIPHMKNTNPARFTKIGEN